MRDEVGVLVGSTCTGDCCIPEKTREPGKILNLIGVETEVKS